MLEINERCVIKGVIVILLIINSRALASPVFRFIVGEERAEFTLHSDLVARQSQKLAKLVNEGCFQENLEQTVVWCYVDKATFTRFAQYVYCGDYGVDGSTTAPLDEADAFINSCSSMRRKKKILPITSLAFSDFKKRHYEYRSDRRLVVEPNLDPSQEYREIFLSHAKLHVFADYHGIEPLMQMTLHKLHQVLFIHSERASGPKLCVLSNRQANRPHSAIKRD